MSRHELLPSQKQSPILYRQDHFRRAMRRCAHTVAVIALGSGNERIGFTATSYCSLSADPPIIVVCVNKGTTASAVLVEGRSFSPNILNWAQEKIADEFAGRYGTHGKDRFHSVDWHESAFGNPALTNAVVTLDCDVLHVLTKANCLLLISGANDVLFGPAIDPLIYHDAQYRQLA